MISSSVQLFDGDQLRFGASTSPSYIVSSSVQRPTPGVAHNSAAATCTQSIQKKEGQLKEKKVANLLAAVADVKKSKAFAMELIPAVGTVTRYTHLRNCTSFWVFFSSLLSKFLSILLIAKKKKTRYHILHTADHFLNLTCF